MSRRRRRALLALLLLVLLPVSLPLLMHLQAWWQGALPPAAAPLPAQTVVDAAGRPILRRVAPDQHWHLPRGRRAGWLPLAVQAVEDRRFRDHGGVDWSAVAAAVVANLGAGGIRRGASTITMQVIRLRYPAARSLGYKWWQAVAALRLEARADKQAILDEYLDRAPFGANVVGAEAAAWFWFATPLERLTLAQAALLAGLPQSPSRLRPDRHPQAALARRGLVLQRMQQLGLIDAQTAAAAGSAPLDLRPASLPQRDHPGLLAAAANLAGTAGGIIATGLDRQRCDEVATLARRLVPAGHSAAVLVIDHDSGRPIALWNASAGLDCTVTRRSSGSLLKPFIYAAAIEQGRLGPTTLLDDAPGDWSGWQPANADHRHGSWLPADQALARSRNLPAIRVLAAGGVGPTLALLRSLGFDGLERPADDYGLSLAIGGGEISLREAAAAYAALARGGVVVAADLGSSPATRPVLRPAVARTILQMLADPARNAALDPRLAGTSVAWKTGTSSGGRDAWCVLVSQRCTVAVWCGFADGRGDATRSGLTDAAPLAAAVLLAVDPLPQGWDRTRDWGQGDPAQLRARQRQASVSIVSPVPGERIVGDGPVVDLRCQGGSGQVTWLINGLIHTETSWRPAPGRYEVRAIDERGQVARSHCEVLAWHQ